MPFYDVKLPARFQMSGDWALGFDVTVLESRTNAVVQTLDTCRRPRGMHFNADHTQFFVGCADDSVVALTAKIPNRLDLSGSSDAEAELYRLAGSEILLGVDLGTGPLLRPVLVQISADEWALLVTAHHIVADGLCVPLIRDALFALYQGRQPAVKWCLSLDIWGQAPFPERGQAPFWKTSQSPWKTSQSPGGPVARRSSWLFGSKRGWQVNHHADDYRLSFADIWHRPCLRV